MLDYSGMRRELKQMDKRVKEKATSGVDWLVMNIMILNTYSADS